MDVRALFGQFLEIQMRQNDLLREIASKENDLQFWKASVELGTQQYKQNQKRLEELHKQLFAEVF